MEDQIIYKFDALMELSENLEFTKRNLLKIIAKFFNSLGMLSPMTIGMKVIFQEVCRSKLEWDERLPEAFQESWRKREVSLRKVRSVHMPRCIYSGINEKVVSYELHGFGDASDRAYCAIVYLVCGPQREICTSDGFKNKSSTTRQASDSRSRANGWKNYSPVEGCSGKGPAVKNNDKQYALVVK